MQCSSVPCGSSLRTGSSASSQKQRLFAQRHAFSSRPAGRALSVQVFAKGKGGRRGAQFGSIPGQAAMYRKAPPVPEVDPDNAEFVIFVRASKTFDPKLGELTVNDPKWVPLTVLKLSGTAGNFLVKSQESPFGRLLFGKTLVKQISQGLYKDKEQLEAQLKKGEGSPFKNSKGFSYAFKIRDKSVPEDWLKPAGITVVPPESEVTGTAVESLGKFFSISNFSKLIGGGSPAQA